MDDHNAHHFWGISPALDLESLCSRNDNSGVVSGSVVLRPRRILQVQQGVWATFVHLHHGPLSRNAAIYVGQHQSVSKQQSESQPHVDSADDSALAEISLLREIDALPILTIIIMLQRLGG